MFLHALNNGLLVSVSYYRDELMAHGWGIEEQRHLPITWHVMALIAILIGVSFLIGATRAVNESPQRQPRSGDIA